MRFPRFIIGLTAGIALSAQAANIDEYINQLPAGANLAFMAQKVGASTPEIDYHSQQMALPASTQKVITALAALLQLGPDFRFTTTLETKGSLDGGVLKGDLIARFGGDPTLKRQDIRNMVATLKKAGVQRIEGNVLIDTSVFASHDKAPGWPWNDLTQCFSAPPAAAIVDRNCFSVSLYSAQKPGDVAFIRVASYYPVTMFSQVRTLARGSSEAQYCELDVVPGDLNRYTLTGCLPQRSEPLPLAFAIQDGASYAGAILKAELAQAGITYSGTLLRQTLANEPGTRAGNQPVGSAARSAADHAEEVRQHDCRHRLSHHRPRPVRRTWHLAGGLRCRTADPASTGWGRSRQHYHRRRLWPVAPQPDRPGDHDAGAAVYRPARYRAQLHLHAAAGGP